jgi:hypothetical protein
MSSISFWRKTSMSAASERAAGLLAYPQSACYLLCYERRFRERRQLREPDSVRIDTDEVARYL